MSRIVDQGNETNTDGQMGELISPPSSAGPAYTLPGEAWLSSATLSQDGFDLVLTLDGATHRVGDYFSFQTPPNLVLETGPSLTPAMVKSLLPRAFASDYLYAGPAAGPGLGEPIGTVSLLAGTATVRRADGSTEALSRGDAIYRGDVLLTGDGSFVKIRFTDGTTFQLGKNGEAALDDFEFNEAANIGNFEASIRVGGFYYKSGKIGEVTEGSADAHTKLSTPSSIISVRGSELEGTVDSSGQTSVIHRSGILVVTDQNGNNAVTLDQPGATAVVAQGGTPAFYAQAPAAVIQQIQASVQPQTGDEDVAPEESGDEAQEEQTEEEASEEEAAEESEEEAEEEVAEEAVEEESEEEETEEDAEEDSEEEAQEESEEETSDSEEADEDAAEDLEEATEEEVAEESADEEASEDEAEAETETEAEEEAAEEEVADESEAEADDEAAQEEEAAEDSAEDEAGDESTEESGEEAAADETSEEGTDEAADEPAEEAADSSSEEGSETQSEEDAAASDSASADEPSDTAADAAAAESASDDTAGTGDAGATESADSGEAATSSAESAEGEAATSDASSPESTAEASDTSGSSGESSSDASQGASEGSTDSVSSESTVESQASGTGTAGDGSGTEGSTDTGSSESTSGTTTSDASASSTSAPSESTAVTTVSANTGQTQASTEAPTSSTEASTQTTSSTTQSSQGTTDATSTEAPVQPVIEQTQEEPPPDNPPEAVPDQLTVVSSEAIRLDELILANDVDVDEGQSPELTAVTAPESVGDIEVTDEGTLFTPNAGVLAALGAGETLTETLEYTVTSGELSASSMIEITLEGANDAPTVTEPASASLLEDSGAEGAVVTTVTGSDIDGDTVTYAITSGNELGYFAIDAGTGEVTLTADGATALNNDALTSTSTTIGVTVSDGTLSSSEAPLEIRFDAQNDAPTTGDDTATVIAGGLVTITAGNGVLANDADVDSSLSVESVVLTTPNSAASPITTAGQSVVGQYGTLTLEADGSFAYSADQTLSLQLLGGEQAVETFSVTVSDGELTDVSTLTITVDGVDDATVFFGDTAFTVDQDVSSQIFPVQGVLSSFDVDQHAVIAPVDAGQGTYGVFGFQPSNDVDGVDGGDPVELPPNGSAFELPFQVIRPDTPVIDQQTGTVTVGLNYEVDDPNTSAPGLVLQIHYDSSVIQNPVLTSNAPGLVQLVDVEDIDNLDFDDATDRMILVAWTSSESLDWPGTLSGPIASLSFESDFSQAQNPWTNIRFTGVAADGFILDAQSIQIYGDSGLPQQADGTLSAGTWGYAPDPDLYRSLADGETVTDEYTFTSSDGQLHPVSVTLVGVNDVPHYQGVYSLSMDSIGTYVFSDQDVTTFDPDDGPTDIVYTVVDAQGGSVFVGGIVVTSFTQDDINNGRVSFVLDSPSFSVSTVTPLLTLSVEDGNEDGSEPELLLLNFTDPNASGLQFVEDPTVNINVDQVAVVAVLTLLANDLGSDGSAVTISSVDTLSEFGGTVSFDGTDITYTPPSGFVGIDRVFYFITDITGATSVASLTFEITQPPPSTKAGAVGEEVIVVDMALPEDQAQPSDVPRLPESEDLSGLLAIENSQISEAVVPPNGALLAGGDNLLFGEAVAESAELPTDIEADRAGEFAGESGHWLADNLVESERIEEAFVQEEQSLASTTEVTGQQLPDAEALNLAAIDELLLEGSHPFLSGSALVFLPESTNQAEQIPSPDELAAPGNTPDIGAIPLLADLLTDGDEWMAAAFAGPSEVSTIQVSVPVTQSAEAYDAAILQYQKAVLDVDILAIETAHIVVT